MKKFLARLSFFVAIGILAGVLFLISTDDISKTDEYLAALSDKHQRIHSIQEPKLIFAGGSNLVFGIDSQRIEEKLQMPTVNLGLQASLGLDFILNELIDVAKEKDVVVLSIEHNVTAKGNRELQKMTSYYNPFARKYYSEDRNSGFTRLKIHLEKYHILFKKSISRNFAKLSKDPVYSRKAINEYGDGVYHLNLPSKSVLKSKAVFKNRRKNEIELLNQFYAVMKKRGVAVVFSYGAYEIEEFKKNKSLLQKIHRDMKDHLEMEMIADLTGFVYPTSYFYDSVYHLNKTGRDIHTDKLISSLLKSDVLSH